MYAQRTSRVPSRAEVARMTAVSSSELALPTPMQSFPERPKPASRLAPKRPDGEPSPFLFRFYEAAVRDLTHSAMTGRWRSAQNFSSQTALDDWFRAANLNSALTCPGQFRSYDWPENRHASDRFQSAAATARRTVDGAYSPKRSLTACDPARHPVQAERRQFSQPPRSATARRSRLASTGHSSLPAPCEAKDSASPRPKKP